jgi:hypothetical protein
MARVLEWKPSLRLSVKGRSNIPFLDFFQPTANISKAPHSIDG